MGRQPYPSDLTDAEWDAIQWALPAQTGRGRKRTLDIREVLNAIFYLPQATTAQSPQPVYLPVVAKNTSSATAEPVPTLPAATIIEDDALSVWSTSCDYVFAGVNLRSLSPGDSRVL